MDLPEQLSEQQVERLIEEAEEVRKNTFSTFTDSSVGAAILTDSGNIYTGCYYESVIQGLGTCAERNAVGNAVSNADYSFQAVAVVGEQEKPITPCGACRQILAEFSEVAEHDITIIMRGQNGETKIEKISEMIPESFGAGEAGADLSEYR
ncbi:cytidine deaminase [Candidatus Nanohalovita haloferacivicina]|uniref:cytidine deaminase n=1 Tax=Candidatus Nanohalovita haloferacivicina TaxID=2978046 RepID=UPI00325FC252|nr:Cytidine deaminase [Candidatus Nanohalobia archaeon BNXNv]